MAKTCAGEEQTNRCRRAMLLCPHLRTTVADDRGLVLISQHGVGFMKLTLFRPLFRRFLSPQGRPQTGQPRGRPVLRRYGLSWTMGALLAIVPYARAWMPQ